MSRFSWSEICQGWAWFVNLKSRPDRRMHMLCELARVGIRAQRFEAFTPDLFPGPEFETMRRRTPGAIGCYMSQLAIIRKAAESGRNVLVLEDDVVFCDDLAERMAHAETFLDGRDWDVLSLAGTVHIGPAVWHAKGHPGDPPVSCSCALERDAETTDDPRFLRMYGSWFTFAYIVNAASAGLIVDCLLDETQTSIGIDYSFINLSERLEVYAYTPGSAWQMDGQSNIGTGITRFSNFAKLGPYAWQRRREDFDPAAFDWKEAQR